jgi:hypothetical protein
MANGIRGVSASNGVLQAHGIDFDAASMFLNLGHDCSSVLFALVQYVHCWALEIARELLHCGINYAVTLFAASPFNLSLIWTAFEIFSSSSATLQFYKISLSHCKILPQRP